MLCGYGHACPTVDSHQVSAGGGESSSPWTPIHPGDRGGIVRLYDQAATAWIWRPCRWLEQAKLPRALDHSVPVLYPELAV
jgi:hypothetical protein